MLELHDHVEGNHADEDRFARTNVPHSEADREYAVPGVPIPLDSRAAQVAARQSLPDP